MDFSIKDFLSKCDPHLLKKSLMENFIFSAVRSIHAKLFVKKFFCKDFIISRNYLQ